MLTDHLNSSQSGSYANSSPENAKLDCWFGLFASGDCFTEPVCG